MWTFPQNSRFSLWTANNHPKVLIARCCCFFQLSYVLLGIRDLARFLLWEIIMYYLYFLVFLHFECLFMWRLKVPTYSLDQVVIFVSFKASQVYISHIESQFHRPSFSYQVFMLILWPLHLIVFWNAKSRNDASYRRWRPNSIRIRYTTIVMHIDRFDYSIYRHGPFLWAKKYFFYFVCLSDKRRIPFVC